MLQQLNKTFIFAVALIGMQTFASAIINIEDLRQEGEIGLFHSISGSVDASRGNRDRNYYTFTYRFDNNTDAIDSFFVLSQSERKYIGSVIDESNFFHGRLVFKNESNLHYELFAQRSENPFRNYRQREVIGVGLRYLINDHARFGFAFINEDEEDLNMINTKTDRLNLYFHDDFEIGENIFFNTTIYVQPSVDNFGDDVKSSAIFALDFEVNEQVTISLQYSRFNDNAPPMNADKMDESISTKFSWGF
ncbi:MAG: hypothetical protein CMH04_00170 [Marinovum sp.]|nr:hypothetical protein [Marinovum sp.]|tara:strand:+ start:1478 stop:2224 length:747 start_codon:yes stop_codon:yes gene_type:complete